MTLNIANIKLLFPETNLECKSLEDILNQNINFTKISIIPRYSIIKLTLNNKNFYELYDRYSPTKIPKNSELIPLKYAKNLANFVNSIIKTKPIIEQIRDFCYSSNTDIKTPDPILNLYATEKDIALILEKLKTQQVVISQSNNISLIKILKKLNIPYYKHNTIYYFSICTDKAITWSFASEVTF